MLRPNHLDIILFSMLFLQFRIPYLMKFNTFSQPLHLKPLWRPICLKSKTISKFSILPFPPHLILEFMLVISADWCALCVHASVCAHAFMCACKEYVYVMYVLPVLFVIWVACCHRYCHFLLEVSQHVSSLYLLHNVPSSIFMWEVHIS